MKKVWFIINLPRIVIAYILYCLSPNKDTITEDLLRWFTVYELKESEFEGLAFLLLYKKEFRNLFSYRLKMKKRIYSIAFEIMFKPMESLFIYCTDIGSGLFIQHGFATVIAAKSVGKNCWVNQQVTIGWNENTCPIIEDNCHICAGAKVIGGVVVGHDSIIGANAVVVKNVPANEVWGGTSSSIEIGGTKKGIKADECEEHIKYVYETYYIWKKS